MDAANTLAEVSRQVAVCQKCTLHHSRKNAVPGEGPPTAEIMCIGEGPGFYENEQGRPFVGQAGKFLEELLASAGLRRAEVFITNVVKCRPPSNRDPLPDELSACSEYLEKQIEAINPRIIVTLGRFSMARYLPNARISEIHGQPTTRSGRVIIPMYHPAAALHQPSLKKTVEEDFRKLPEILKQTRQTTAKPSPMPRPASPEEHGSKDEQTASDQPFQLSLF